MIKYVDFIQVRSYDKRVVGETPKSTIKVEFCRAFDIIKRKGLLNLLKDSPEIGTQGP